MVFVHSKCIFIFLLSCRFFGVSQTALVDGATTGAFIRSPKNHTTHIWDPARPILFQLVALNFIPHRHGLELRLVHEGTPHRPNDDHQVALPLPVGSTCVTALAVRYTIHLCRHSFRACVKCGSAMHLRILNVLRIKHIVRMQRRRGGAGRRAGHGLRPRHRPGRRRRPARLRRHRAPPRQPPHASRSPLLCGSGEVLRPQP